MRVTTLIENKLGDRDDLDSEHGICVYVEVNGKTILFDTGQSGDFIDNANKLDIDLKELDYVVISHGHHDHSGGFMRLICEVKPNIELYIGLEFFNKKYSLRKSGKYKYLGNPFNESFLRRKNIKTKYIDSDITEMTNDVLVFSNFDRDEEFENINTDMYFKRDGRFEKDRFLDEISIGVKTKKGLVVIVGCSHVGIVNILSTIIKRTGMNIYALIGGTHLIREDDMKINKIIDYLKENDIKVIGACHCTGKQGETMLMQQLGDNFVTNNTGDVLEF